MLLYLSRDNACMFQLAYTGINTQPEIFTFQESRQFSDLTTSNNDSKGVHILSLLLLCISFLIPLGGTAQAKSICT